MKTLFEEYGVIIVFLIIFGILLNYFYGLVNLAANGNLMTNYQSKLK